MEPRSYLQVPVAEIKSHDVARDFDSFRTVRRTLNTFIRGELSHIVIGINIHARPYLKALFDPEFVEDRETLEAKINAHPEIVSRLRELREQRGGVLARRFPVPGYDKSLALASEKSFHSEEALAAIDEINDFVFALNQLQNPYDIFVASNSFLSSLPTNGHREP